MRFNNVKNLNIKQNSQSFQGKYLLKGPRNDIEALYALIKKENDIIGSVTDFFDLSDDVRTVVVDKHLINNLHSENDVLSYVVKASEVWDSVKNTVAEKVHSFYPREGCYIISESIELDDFSFIKSSYNVRSNLDDKGLCLENFCDFKQELPFKDAFNTLNRLNRKYFTVDGAQKSFSVMPFSIHSYFKIPESIADSQFFSQFRVNKFLGSGAHSIHFDIGDEKVLKISTVPCCPKVSEDFDVNVYDTDFSAVDKVHWGIVQRGKSQIETRISEPDMKILLDNIHNKGFYTMEDLKVFSFQQAVKVQGETKLADFESAYPLGGGRLYDGRKTRVYF